MIYATLTGAMVSHRDQGPAMVGRILTGNGLQVQFTARRGIVRAALAALPVGTPVSVAGELTTCARTDKDGRPYVHHELAVRAVQTAQPPESSVSLIGSIFRKAKP